jgi:hypothetical protein
MGSKNIKTIDYYLLVVTFKYPPMDYNIKGGIVF